MCVLWCFVWHFTIVGNQIILFLNRCGGKMFGLTTYDRELLVHLVKKGKMSWGERSGGNERILLREKEVGEGKALAHLSS